MIDDNELLIKIKKTLDDYEGNLEEFYMVVGLVVVGRLVGWRVVRLVSSRKTWKLANELFGDLKQDGYIMPERGEFAHRSVGLQIIDKIGDYWLFISGNKSREELPLHQRKHFSKKVWT